jgi:hypothetical protein
MVYKVLTVSIARASIMFSCEFKTMDWGFIVTIFFTAAFGIATIVLALKFAKRKRPVWAYKTNQVIGIGSDAPPELKLTFNDKLVSDVYKTELILFNSGNEAIRKDDVSNKICVRFIGAEILREPSIKAKSKEEIRLSASRIVMDEDNAVELDFSYLDHKDGAVVEILHTACNKISCEGNIIGAGKPRYIGTLDRIRPRHSVMRLLLLAFPVLLAGVVVAGLYFTGRSLLEEAELLWFLIIIAASFYAFIVPTLIRFYGHLRFPRWSWIPEG